MPRLLWSLKGNIRNENKMGKAFGVIGSSFNFEHREKIETWGIGDARFNFLGSKHSVEKRKQTAYKC